ncbi:MAG: hypothetical protein IJQ36_08375 [Oscillospiraceae bacterium]|nr:hypothetical protein [Oscillospiraceae bacterium]
MKNIKNMNALDDMEMAAVAGGMIWPGIPPLDPFNPLNENRPLPFPQDRRGNKAPLDMKRDTWEYVYFDSWKWENLR